METPLTPLEFARRARKLYGYREAVVDGSLRLTYEQFFERCDRWSAALQAMGVRKGDRVAYIAPNTHEQLESFYAVPQTGAVLVPINYRLTADDFVYITSHSGAKVLCVHPDYLEVMDTLVHFHITVDDTYLWTLPMFHANGWTFVWIITAAGGRHICLPKVEPARVFDLVRSEQVGWLCAAPTVLISLANAPASARGDVPKGVQVITAGAPPAAATIERLEGEFGWNVTQVYGLTETSPFLTICEPRPEHAKLSPTERGLVKAKTGVEMIGAGEMRVVDSEGKEVPMDGEHMGEIVFRGNVILQGYYRDPEATEKVMV